MLQKMLKTVAFLICFQIVAVEGVPLDAGGSETSCKKDCPESKTSTDDTLSLLTLNKKLIHRTDQSIASLGEDTAGPQENQCGTFKCNTDFCGGELDEEELPVGQRQKLYQSNAEEPAKVIHGISKYQNTVAVEWRFRSIAYPHARYCREIYGTGPGKLVCDRVAKWKESASHPERLYGTRLGRVSRNPFSYFNKRQVCKSCTCRNRPTDKKARIAHAGDLPKAQ